MNEQLYLTVTDRLNQQKIERDNQQQLVNKYTAMDNMIGANSRQVAVDRISDEIIFLTKLLTQI